MKNNTVPYLAIPLKPLPKTSVISSKLSTPKSTLPLFLFILFICGIIFTSCSLFSGSGKTTKTEAKGRAKIVNVESQLNSNTSEKLNAVSQLAYGTDYALSKVNDPPREVVVARDINQRVVSLAGNPTIDKMKEMQETIDKLISTLAKEREVGAKRLNDKDAEIADLQSETKMLLAARDSEIRKYMINAQEAAQQLQEYQGWLGLKAVWKGMWQFISSAAWILGIGSILFLILRLGAMSNPICGAVFGIFNQIGSWMIHTVAIIFPKALSIAGNVSTELFNKYKGTMTKLVDCIQLAQSNATASGKTATIEDALNEASKSMNTDEKEIVTEIKKALHWK